MPKIVAVCIDRVAHRFTDELEAPLPSFKIAQLKFTMPYALCLALIVHQKPRAAAFYCIQNGGDGLDKCFRAAHTKEPPKASHQSAEMHRKSCQGGKADELGVKMAKLCGSGQWWIPRLNVSRGS